VSFDLAGLAGAAAQATPWGAGLTAATDLAKGFTDSGPSSARGAPVTGGPVSVNIAGFGSKSSSTATQDLKSSQSDGGDFPAATSAPIVQSMPQWFLPALGLLLVVAVGGHFLKRRG
jgi:hypothetical protein